MHRGDIYFCNLDPTAGHEQAGTRPVFVVSPFAFNKATGTPIVLPITNNGGFARGQGFAVDLGNCGTQTTGFVLCHQPRALDLSARKAKYREAAPQAIVDEVLARLFTLLT